MNRHDIRPAFFQAMSTTEILEELPKLKLADRWAILQRLSELETKEEIDPSPEMAAAIEAGLRSAENEPCPSFPSCTWEHTCPRNFVAPHLHGSHRRTGHPSFGEQGLPLTRWRGAIKVEEA